MHAADKERLQETVVESLVESLTVAKADRDHFQNTAQMLGTILTALLGAVSDDGTYALTPEQVQAVQQKSVRWQVTPEGGVALVTVE